MAGINLGTAFMQIVPSFRGGVQEAAQAGQQMGNAAGDSFGDRFSTDVNGRLRDERGRFVTAGNNLGDALGRGVSDGMEQGAQRGSQSVERESKKAGKESGGGFLSEFGGEAAGGAGEVGEMFGGGMIKGLGPAALGAAAAAMFVDAYTDALDFKKAQALTQAQLGVDPATAELMGKSAAELYKNGYGESIAEMQGLVTSVSSALPELYGDSLVKMSGQISSFSEAFGFETADVATKLNTMLNSGLAKDAPEALNLLTAGMQRVPEALRGDLMDAVDEYGKSFTQLGFSGSEAFQALTDASGLGMYGIDKTGDAIKEFTILATDGSKSTTEAFQSLGLDATKMSNDILAGGDTAAAATSTIIEALQGIQDPSTQAQTALALFGTPLEDLGVDKIPQFLGALHDMNGGMVGAEGAADKMDAAMGSTTSGVEYFWRGLKTNLVDFMMQKVIPALTMVAQWLGEKLAPVVEKVGIWFNEKLVPFLKLAWEWFTVNLLPAIERVGEFLVSSFGNFMDVIGGIIDFIVGIFTGDWAKAWDGIKQAFGAIWQQIQDSLSAVWDVIVSIIQNIGPTIWQWIQDLGAQLPGWGAQLLTWIGQGLEAAWPYIQDFFAKLPGRIWDALVALTGFLVEKGGEFLSWLGQGLINYLPTVLQWFSELPQTLWNAILALANFVVERGQEFLSWLGKGLIDALPGVLAWFASVPTQIWDAIKGAFSNVQSWGATLISSMIDGIRDSKGYLALEIAKVIMDSVGQLGIPVDTLLDISGLNVSGTIDDLIRKYDVQQAAAGGYGGAGYGGRGGTPGFAEGGPVWGPGTPTSDSILARLSTGEFVNDAESTRKNRPYLEYANDGGDLRDLLALPGFAAGGLVGAAGKVIGASLIKKLMPILTEKISGDLATVTPSFAGNGNWGPENFGGLAANTAAARAFVQKTWGINNIGGWSPSGSVATSDHPKGKALDVMIANYLSQAGIAQGTSVADWFINNPNAFGTKYVIWRDRINQNGAWSPYSHPSGNNDTLQHRDHVHLSFLTGGGEFAGQATSAPVGDTPKSIFAGLSAAIRSKVGGLMGSGGGAEPSGAGVERWRSMGLQALTAVGNYLGRPLTQYIDKMLMQMGTESGGDPNAVNNWDSNAMRGTPSKGLLQVIQPTFETALRNSPFANLIGRGTTDPWANMIASIMYGEVTGPYHSLDRAYRGVAYDNGGWLLPGVNPVSFLDRPEPVLTGPQWDTAGTAIDIVKGMAQDMQSASASGPLVSVGHIETVRGTPQDVVDELMWRARAMSR